MSNRSYYEEVLIARVHPAILQSEGLPDVLLDEKTVWRDRFRSIVDLEQHLSRNGTRIIKFFLHLSKEEQRKRFLQRIDEPEKNWMSGAILAGSASISVQSAPALHCMSISGIECDENISVLGACAKSDRHRRRDWGAGLDRLGRRS